MATSSKRKHCKQYDTYVAWLVYYDEKHRPILVFAKSMSAARWYVVKA